MKEVHVVSEAVRRTKNTIKGTFRLSDKSTTSFEIDRENGWEQWGNTTGNLGVTVARVEQLQKELLDI